MNLVSNTDYSVHQNDCKWLDGFYNFFKFAVIKWDKFLTVQNQN